MPEEYTKDPNKNGKSQPSAYDILPKPSGQTEDPDEEPSERSIEGPEDYISHDTDDLK